MNLSTLLVANRGEIACRVMRTARRLGIRTVAVYSQADALSPHVAMADAAVCIGPAAAQASYLRIDAILDAAARTGADAVHPGYGFLSERAELADACAAAGLVFVGPPAAAIRAMGDKAAAKRRMAAAGVPCVPGWMADEGLPPPTDEEWAAHAGGIGWPLLVKAVAGGGGRGMRLVHAADDLPAALAGARREAVSAFGDGTLMLERLVAPGRHIEVQVFADVHGHLVHLGERDCSVQRRRQKLIEETPSPAVGPALRERLCADALAAARAVGYVGAGTVEFIVDAEGRHFFLEMNTRLQVEHTVTECVTGLDLVEWQLRVAAGEPLPRAQHEIRFEGHAIQARLLAEDPYDGWAPQSGPVHAWRPGRAAVRIDDGLAEGGTVPPHYDAMVAKLVAHGRHRADAARRLAAALEDAVLIGPRHNARFLRDVLRHADFAEARIATDSVDAWAAQGHPLLQRPAPPEAAWRLAAALRAGPVPGAGTRPPAGWHLTLHCDGHVRTQPAPPEGVQVLHWQGGELRAEIDGIQRRAFALSRGPVLWLAWEAAVFRFDEPAPGAARAAAAGHGRVVSPVAGTVVQVAMAPGAVVAAGQPLACVESMKMELWVPAPAAGTVRTVAVAPGTAVAAGALLAEIDAHTGPEGPGGAPPGAP